MLGAILLRWNISEDPDDSDGFISVRSGISIYSASESG